MLRFLVRERPNIAAVVFKGNDEIDNDDLKDGIEVKANTVLSYPAIRRSVQKIRDMYAEKGYFLAEVQQEIVPEKNNEVTVKFKITEHGQVSVRRITFIGNEAISDAELRQTMFTGNAGFFAFGSGGPFRQDAFERDIAVISALYYDRGFLSVNIATPRVMLTPDKNGIEITLTIDEGPRYKIRQLRVYERGPNGEEVEPIGGRRKLRNMVRAKSGDYFNRAELLDDLQSIRTMYRDHGYANVEANPQTRLDPKTQQVDVVVPIVRGPLVHFERIEVRGNTKTRDKVIRREMEIAEGEQVQRDPAREVARAHHGSRLLRARRHLHRAGLGARQDERLRRGDRAADRHLPGRRGLLQHRELHRHGAGATGQPLRQRPEPVAPGAGQRPPPAGQPALLRALLPRQQVLDAASISFDQLRIYNDFSQSSRGGVADLRLPARRARAVASLTYTAELDQVSTQTTVDLPRYVAAQSACSRACRSRTCSTTA